MLSHLEIRAKQIEPFITEADKIHNKDVQYEVNKKTSTLRVWENATNALRSQIKAIQ